ncbi:glycosyltransferase family 2 protein [uncultured Thiothrix sp.]|uniref:glycosyltransferase family 2 protein n=1 Tax=uncultured Thiothrix sp. TaxID=223185 RepID=UPI0026169E33|nr:glycosyltransferase family 2 protein [uncultured Thiothrix sp.]
MLKLVYKAAKPYLYPNLAKKMLSGVPVEDDYYSTQNAIIDHEFKPGWYMLELQVKGVFGTANLDLRFDTSHNMPLAIRPQKLMKRIVYLPRSATQAHLSLRLYGDGVVKLFRLVPIKERFAQDRMLKRLVVSAATNKEDLTKRLHERAHAKKIDFNQFIFSAYNRLFYTHNETDYHTWIEEIEVELIRKLDLEDTSTPCNVDDYVCVVDPDYTLYNSSKDLLIRFLSKHPDALLVYPDEDYLDEYGNRSKPWFKTDWNPDLFLTQDYISTCFICRKSWYEANKETFNKLGNQQALAELLPSLGSQQIIHLPLVLAYKHTETNKKTTELEKELALLRAEVLKSALPSVSSYRWEDETLIFDFKIPEPQPLVSLIIPTRDRLSILQPCVESILEKTTYENFEILILDNQSKEAETLIWFERIQNDPRVKVIQYDYPFNYSAINNFGVQQAKGSIIGLINNDVEIISANWLTELVSHACRAEVGCVGAKLYYSNGQIQHAGVILGLGHVAGHAHRFAERDSTGYFNRLKVVQNYSAVTGACLLVRREIYEQVGGLNEQDLAVAYNDVDFCLRVRAVGYRNLWTPHAELYHHESVSRGEDDTPEKKARFDKEVAYMRATWGTELDNDPYYNLNLSRLREDFSLREFV